MRAKVIHVELSGVVDAAELGQSVYTRVNDCLILEKFDHLARLFLVALRHTVLGGLVLT